MFTGSIVVPGTLLCSLIALLPIAFPPSICLATFAFNHCSIRYQQSNWHVQKHI
jgi:ABC-type phosphate transport system permease subunit